MTQESELVPGFYSETDDTLRLEIERMEGLERGMVIRMSGYLDGFNVTFFSRRVEKVMDKGYIFLSFDLADIRYISSRGIGAFTSFLKALRARGGNIHLFRVRPKVLEVFRILGFLEYFNIDKSRDEAVEVFRKISRPPAPPSFPLRLRCPVCNQVLNVPGAGRGRCPACKCELRIDKNGGISGGGR